MFVLNSEITIGKFHFTGVHSVRITKSIHSLTDTAVIELPSLCKVKKNGKICTDSVVTASKFKNNDAVVIRLGYNGLLQEEFRGFVKHTDRSMPLQVICEGYGRELKQSKKIDGFYASISIKALAQMAVDATTSGSISMVCDDDIVLTNVHLVKMNAADIIGLIIDATDGCISIFFIKPDVLWMGTIYTKYANGKDAFSLGKVSYRPGYNTPRDNDLGIKTAADEPVTVSYNKKLATGEQIGATSGTSETAKQYKKILNHISSATTLQTLAKEKQLRMSYDGYEGRLNTFLQPYASPGFTAYITDPNYPANDGTYLAETVEVTFGVRGGRRSVEVGPRFNKSNQ